MGCVPNGTSRIKHLLVFSWRESFYDNMWTYKTDFIIIMENLNSMGLFPKFENTNNNGAADDNIN
jgi:hypothetical protein